MGYYKIGRSVFVSLLVVLSASFVPRLPMVLMTSRVLAQTVDARKAEADRLLDLGLQQGQKGQLTAALQSWEQALKIYREIQYPTGEASALTNLGYTYNFLGKYKQAIKFHEQSLAIFRKIDDRFREGKVLGNLGIAYFSLGEYNKAINWLQKRLAIAEEIGDRPGEAAALGNLGSAYLSLRDYKKAIDLFEKSLAIAKELSNTYFEGRMVGNLGVAYRNLGEYGKAVVYFQRSVAIAIKIDDLASFARALGNLGNSYVSLGDYQKAINFYQQDLAISKELDNRAGVGIALNNLGAAFFITGNFVEAENFLKQAIKIHKSQRRRLENRNDFKISIFEEQSRTYRTLQEVLIAQNKIDEALEVAESGRARAFVDLLTSRLSPNDNVSFSTDATINQIKEIAKSHNSTLVQYSIIYDVFKIAPGEQAKESELYIWVIKPTGEITFRKADLKPLWQKENTTLGKLVSTTRKSLGIIDDERGIFSAKFKNPVNEKIQKENLQKLHQLLVKPIADLLPTDSNQRVTFVPQSDLFLVPFPALMNSKGKYLIEKHTILTAPAIQVLELTRQQQQRIKSQQRIPAKSGQNALIVGNPTMPKFNTKYGEPGKQLSSLPGAKREAQAIAPLFNTTALTGDEATETAIKAKLPQAGLIHLATHGLFDDFQGLQSSIALAPSSQDNGLLTASEILDIKLNADLVVLSACNTGRGKITGDGVIGLSRSLISAGVPSVLVSLWSVPDSPTASLMTDFYQNLSKNPDKATALREAMLTRMKQHPNPRDWAAFTLIGEAE